MRMAVSRSQPKNEPTMVLHAGLRKRNETGTIPEVARMTVRMAAVAHVDPKVVKGCRVMLLVGLIPSASLEASDGETQTDQPFEYASNEYTRSAWQTTLLRVSCWAISIKTDTWMRSR
jgi:hypothetical protein